MSAEIAHTEETRYLIVAVDVDQFEELYAESHYPARSEEACILHGHQAVEHPELLLLGITENDVVEIQIDHR